LGIATVQSLIKNSCLGLNYPEWCTWYLS